MKKNLFLSLLIIPFLLISCGGGSDPTIDPTETPTENPTEEPTEEVPTETPSTGNSELEQLAKDKLSTRRKTVNHINSFGETPVTELYFSFEKSGLIESSSESISVMFTENEIYKTSEKEKVESSQTLYTYETFYTGIVGESYYFAEINKDNLVSSIAREYLITNDDIQSYEIDKITPEKASELVSSEMAINDLSILGEYGYWKEILSNTTYKDIDHELVVRENFVRTISNGYSEGYQCTLYNLIVTFDESLNITSGTFTVSKYSKENWDLDAHSPLEDAEATSVTKISLDGVTYGVPSKTGNKPLYDVSKYLVSSLKDEVTLSNFVYDSSTGTNIVSDPNTLFAREPVDAPTATIQEQKLYLPETALNIYDLYITSSSDETVVTTDEFGWVVVGEPGTTATLTIGNAKNNNLAEIEITVVKSPLLNKPMFAYNVFMVSEEGTYENSGSRPSLTVDSMNPIIMAVTTHNAGPFDVLPVGFYIQDKNIISVKLCEDQEQYYDISTNAIYFEVTPLAKGETWFAVLDATVGEGVYEITIIIN